METFWQRVSFILWFPLIVLAALISNRVDGAPDIGNKDHRAFKWLPWGRKAK